MSVKNEYPEFSSWEWKSYDGTQKVDIQNFIKSNLDADFYIGTDSQNYQRGKKHCIFTTVVVAYRKGRGGSIVLHTDKTNYMEHLRQRLLLEAMRSLETGWCVEKLIKKNSIVTIHLDVNENLKYKSAQYKDELVGLVMAQGFKAQWKPYSWAASGVADSKT